MDSGSVQVASPDCMQHLAIEVQDMEKSILFYREILGMKLTEEHKAYEIKEIPVDLSFLRLRQSRNHHDLVLVHDPKKKYQEKAKGLSPNFHHMGFSFKDEASWLRQMEHVKSCGAKIVRGPLLHSPFQESGDGSWGENKSFYLLDPDDHKIEFFCHMATIDDEGFYRNELGALIHKRAKAVEV